MTYDAKRAYDWLVTLASGKGFASYLIGAPEEARHAAELIKKLYAELETKDNLIAKSQELHIKAERTITLLIKQNKQIMLERDAAVSDVKSLCATNYFSGDYCAYCKYKESDGQCHHDCVPYSEDWGWEWRGPCAENGGIKHE